MAISVERRVPSERRQRDIGLRNGYVDRRRCTERRLPELVEVLLSDSDWEKFFGGMAKAPSSTTETSDRADEVFSRVRDGF